MKKIKFISNRPWLNSDSVSKPKPIGKLLPEWYKKADRFFKMPSGEYFSDPVNGKIPTWKACPSIYDVMISGYTYLTPYDIEVTRNENGEPVIQDSDQFGFPFVHSRGIMPDFPVPDGYEAIHFAWWPDWAVELPKGHSALYIQPINRFDLPFLTTSGIIDNDKVFIPGTMPFFIKKGFSGTIPAGTPYVQIIPFKRQDWESEYSYESDPEKIYLKNFLNSKKYRVPDGGVYQRDIWSRRTYK